MLFDQNSSLENIASVILAGGKGTRLHPLTINHAKPSVSYGGRYRLIDIPISNSLNSKINKILVIGQYLPDGLKNHLDNTYSKYNFSKDIEFTTPEKDKNNNLVFYEGTADAVRKNIKKIFKFNSDYILILSGDQLYNIDFKEMYEFAKKNDADLTIASLPVTKNDAKRLGILKTNENFEIIDFFEKPQKDEILNSLKMLQSNDKKKYLGSMGIYIFKTKSLEKLLTLDPRDDFGKHLIPTQLSLGKTFSYIYNGYWEDIGTIKSFYEANISLSLSKCGLKTYDEINPIYTTAHNLPGAKIKNSLIVDSIICEGCIIEACKISRSMIGIRTRINKNALIEDSVLLGNTTYNSLLNTKNIRNTFEIGENTIIKKAIIDEHVKIGKNVKLINKNNYKNFDGKEIFVKDGIIIVTAESIIPNNYEF